MWRCARCQMKISDATWRHMKISDASWRRPSRHMKFLTPMRAQSHMKSGCNFSRGAARARRRVCGRIRNARNRLPKVIAWRRRAPSCGCVLSSFSGAHARRKALRALPCPTRRARAPPARGARHEGVRGATLHSRAVAIACGVRTGGGTQGARDARAGAGEQKAARARRAPARRCAAPPRTTAAVVLVVASWDRSSSPGARARPPHATLRASAG